MDSFNVNGAIMAAGSITGSSIFATSIYGPNIIAKTPITLLQID